ncbi:MAG TPA: DMT family transporter [Steroidobacteraceae bacterium]|nr:DMT family transporter [Steroidobacteraceae bacterium]
MRPRLKGPVLAVSSAVLFGASTPVAKRLLGEISPWALAGLLYLGAGIGLAVWWLLPLARRRREARLARAHLGVLAAVVLSGGIIAPVLLMLGLAALPASTVALLLNLEGVFTLAIAWVIFREHVDLRIGSGAAAILLGAAILSWPRHGAAFTGGVLFGWSATLAVAGACLAWAIDNNLTRKLSVADPLQVAAIKDLISGAVNVGLALTLGARIASPAAALATASVGFIGYGLSLVLFMLALRNVGTARTAAYFSLAPFIGAGLAIPLLGEPLSWGLCLAAALMALGLWAHLTERHEHEHEHEPTVHEHAHVHDEHHQHAHAGHDPSGEPHSHVHAHARLLHAHPHFPDIHHRHGH